MQQLISVWFAIDGQRRAVVAISVIAMFAAVIGISKLATSPNLSLLYSSLDPGSSGEVISALEQQGVMFEVRGDSIFVDSSRRDQLRMMLAGDGLPASNGNGYEILDNLSGFGTTAQMFDAAYWRAKEGELARTIAASPQFRTARVHISNTASQPFRRSIDPSASVTITSSSGALSAAHAKALRYLISSAVAGMSADNVSVIDGRNGVVVANDDALSGASMGNERAAELKQNIERLLEARVGPGNAVVEVFMDIATESEAITERVFDPDSRVAISSEKTERNNSSNNTRGGAVTVASNLPDGDGAQGDNKSTSQDSETTELVNYEFSETTRELLRVPGSIKLLSIAVLVNGILSTDPATNSQVWAPRSEDELSTLRDLVASASGLNETRGDTLTLKSLEFREIEVAGEIVELSLFQRLNLDVMRIIQLAVLGVVSLVLGLFVLRPILTSNTVPALPQASNVPGLAGPRTIVTPEAVGQSPAPGAVLTGEIDDRTTIPAGLETIQPAPVAAIGPTVQSTSPADPVERLREMIADRQDETVDILRNWIDGKEEHV